MKKTILIFDWGDTIMRDLGLPGPMKNWDSVEWVPGAEEMLKEISPEFTCCIATSAAHSDTWDMIAALGRVGADQYFKHFFSSKDLGSAKPDPAFFIKIADKLGIEPRDGISIGNLYEKDIEPARKAGLITIWFNENKLTGDFPAADYIINEWASLKGIVKNYR